jgi:hypothetical protein
MTAVRVDLTVDVDLDDWLAKYPGIGAGRVRDDVRMAAADAVRGWLLKEDVDGGVRINIPNRPSRFRQ